MNIIDLTLKKSIKGLSGHKGRVPFIALSSDGKYVVSASDTETIIWDSKTFDSIMTIEEKIVLSFSKHRLLAGVLHDGLYKSWSKKLLRDFSDDFDDEDDTN